MSEKSTQLTATKKRSRSRNHTACAKQITGQLLKISFQNFPVSVIPGHTLHENGKRCDQISNEFPGTFSYCLPLQITHVITDEQNHDKFSDPATQLVIDKDKYLFRLQNYIGTHSRRKDRNKGYKNYEKLDVHLKSVALLAEHLENDPDEFFEGNYDWYFTGGNLQTVSYDGNSYILKNGGESLDKLSILPFKLSKNKNLVLNNETMDKQLQSHCPLYEIGVHEKEFKAVFASTRQKHKLCLFAFENIETIEPINMNLRLVKSFTSKVPFISSTCDKNTFLTLDLSKRLKIWDVFAERSCGNIELNFGRQHETVNKWMTVENYGDNLNLVANRCCMKVIDTRLANDSVMAMTYCWKDCLELTESISSVAKSKFENFFYVGTTYRLFGVDIRKVGGNFNTVQHLRWTHNLNIAPSILKTTFDSRTEHEWVACSNNLCGDVKICINTRKGDTYQSPYMPFKPYNIRDTYRLARQNGKCLTPLSSIHERINLCTTGLTFYQDDNSQLPLLITQNSIGDLFYQNYQPIDDTNDGNFKICMHMHNWMEYLDQKSIETDKEPFTFNVTDTVNMSPLCEVLKSNKLRAVCAANASNSLPTKLSKKIPKWHQTTDQMQMYRDALAQDMLAIWDVNSMNVNGPFGLGQGDTQHVDVISDWFDRSNNYMTVIKAVPEVSDDRVDFSQTSDLQSQEPKKPTRKSNFNKSKHVQGF